MGGSVRRVAKVGLPDRRHFEEVLAGRAAGTPWVVVHLSGLLTLNLTAGWDAGNRFVEATAGELAGMLDDDDVVAHVGGCEFAILPADARRGAVEDLVHRLRSRFHRTVVVGGRAVPVDVTITVSSTQDDGSDPFWVGLHAHRTRTGQTLRQRVRATFDAAHRPDELAAVVAEHVLQSFGRTASEVELDGHLERRGAAPHGAAWGSMPVCVGDGVVGEVRWCPAQVESGPVPSSVLEVIADELGRACQRAITSRDASVDPLTGLLNRRGLRAAFAAVDLPYAVAMLELDDMKRINDTWGHATGDLALVGLARAIGQGRRGEVAARWGGDEFVMVLPGASRADAAGRLRRLLCQVGTDQVLAVHRLTFSAGVTDGSGDLDHDIDAADLAMYQAKRAGKSQVVVAST